MLNQVANISDKSVFTPIRSNSKYAITKPFTEIQKQEHAQEKEKEKHRKTRRLGFAIAAGTLVVGGGIFLATQLLSRKSGLNIKNLSKKLEEKSSKLAENKQLSSIQHFYSSAIKKAKNLLSKSQTIFNLATMKDIWFARGFKKTSVTRKFNEVVTNFFERVSIGTTKISYNKTASKFEKFYAKMTEASSKLPTEQAEIVKAKIENVKTNYSSGFGEEARAQRFAHVKNGLDGIDKTVWDNMYGNLKVLKEKALKGIFIAEEAAAPTKIKFNDAITKAKEKLTISIFDNYHTTRSMLANLDSFIDGTDKGSKGLIKQLRTQLREYKKVLESGVSGKKAFPQSDIAKTLEELNAYILKSGKYDEKTIKLASKSINDLVNVLRSDKKGEIQEIMQIYKQYLPQEDYEKLKRLQKEALKSLDVSADLEGDKLFDKVRDLYLGSAPHDTLAFLASLGLVGWYLGKADNNDERISAALKYGIPAIGGVAIATLCTVGLIASGPSLIIGGISGLLINKLGEGIDDVRKKRNQKTQL